MSTPAKMLELFAGSQAAHGRFVISASAIPHEGSKVEGRAKTVAGPATEGIWQDHLEKRSGLGVIPIMPGNLAKWGCLDIDVYPLNFGDWEKLIEGSPLVLIKSKSGGAHLYVFLGEAVPARVLREKLGKVRDLLHLPRATEIFPKQSELSETQFGNWLNMPYFGDTRKALKDGVELGIEEFLEYVETKKCDISELTVKENYASWSDAPPCLESLHAEGIREGFRNNGLYNLAIYAKKKFGDAWQNKVDEFNQTVLEKPLASSEVSTLVNSIGKNSKYSYRCSEAPIANYCNQQTCQKRKFGISGGGGGTPSHSAQIDAQFGQIVVIRSEPPTFLIPIADSIVRVQVPDLLDQNRFRRAVMCIIPSLILERQKQHEWDNFLREKLESAEYWDAPSDTTISGQVIELVNSFVNGGAQARTEADIAAGKPFKADDQRVYFRSSDLMRVASAEKSQFSIVQIWAVLQEFGVDSSTIEINNTSHLVWSLPLDKLQQLPSNLPVPPLPETEI